MAMNLELYAEQVLMGTRMQDKLLPPSSIIDPTPSRKAWLTAPDEPGRPPALRYKGREARMPFPSKSELAQDQKARGAVLHFFANHELLAIEIMALTLLRFPDAPANFRIRILETIAEEQKHLRAYCERMEELGVALGEVPVNRFFWSCLRTMRDPLDFVVGMSLTFEQANLDFARYYRDLFGSLGDEKTSRILEEVYEDEIGHVKHGIICLDRWKDKDQSHWQAYVERLQLPLSPARAKGAEFDREARERAGLPKHFIEQLYVYAGTKGRPPALYWYNADCELELARETRSYQPQPGMQKVMSELMSCLMFVAKPGDVVLTQKPPSLSYLGALRELGVSLPQFETFVDAPKARQSLIASRRWDALKPWGWTPRSLRFAHELQGDAQLPIQHSGEDFWQNPWMTLFRKSALPALRQELRVELGEDASLWGPPEADGALVHDMTDVLVAISHLHQSFGTPAVIKSPYGFAGTGMLRAYPGQMLSESQVGWIEKQLKQYGAVLIEPWLKRITDLSVVWSEDQEAMSSFVFFTNAKGQYKGHALQSFPFALSAEQRGFLFETKRSPRSAYDHMILVAQKVRERLAEKGYRYSAGIDTMLYEWKGRCYLRVLGEVNCRMTMGHVARGLRSYVSAHQASLWQSVTASEAQARGWPSLAIMADYLQAGHPPRMKQGLVEKGLFFTNDPAASEQILGIVAVGTEAIEACSQASPQLDLTKSLAKERYLSEDERRVEL